MSNSLVVSSATSRSRDISQGESGTALNDSLARCRRQLGIGLLAHLGKPPEGKKIIQSLQARIVILESRIDNRKQNPSVSRASTPSNVLLGNLVNVYT